MQFPIGKFVVIAAASAIGAVIAMFRGDLKHNTFRDPSDDGPRALIAEFFGSWVGFMFVIWSFNVEGKTIHWTLCVVGSIFALAGFGLSAYFANTPEVSDIPDKEPTGFKNDFTELHIH